jgi:serine/threonine-protein kinase
VRLTRKGYHEPKLLESTLVVPDESGPSDGSLDTTEVQGQVTVTVPRLEAGMDPQPGTRVGEYVIERKIGRGGMGTVFAAVHPVIGKKAAIKVMAWDLCRDASFVARFIREARAVNRIRHPNIVEAFSIGQLEDGRCCYTMEWLDGVSLGARLRQKPMPLAEVIAILDQIADALEAVHEAGIVHRDLTPQNLFIVEVRGRRTVKILDFGIAKETGLDSAAGVHTHSGEVLGTPPYAAPEQAAGEPVDARADIYALGAIGYEMLTGHPPFAGASRTDVMARKRVEAPPPIAALRPDVPAELAAVIDGMLAIEPGTRPTLRAARAALAGCARPAPRTRSMRGAAALLAGAVVGTAGYLALRGLSSEEPPARNPAPAPVRAAPIATAPVADAAPLPPDAAPGAAIDIAVDADDARIELDGEVVGAAVRRLRVPVGGPGGHRLVVTAPGRERFERLVQVAAGATASIEVSLVPVRTRTRVRREHTKPVDRKRPEDDPDYLLRPKKLPD